MCSCVQPGKDSLEFIYIRYSNQKDDTSAKVDAFRVRLIFQVLAESLVLGCIQLLQMLLMNLWRLFQVARQFVLEGAFAEYETADVDVATPEMAAITGVGVEERLGRLSRFSL
jgi:hypothetical protein